MPNSGIGPPCDGPKRFRVATRFLRHFHAAVPVRHPVRPFWRHAHWSPQHNNANKMWKTIKKRKTQQTFSFDSCPEFQIGSRWKCKPIRGGELRQPTEHSVPAALKPTFSATCGSPGLTYLGSRRRAASRNNQEKFKAKNILRVAILSHFWPVHCERTWDVRAETEESLFSRVGHHFGFSVERS